MKTPTPKIITIKISELKLTLFVRVALNHKRVDLLMKLEDNGVKLDPIKVNQNMEVIDGRHRIRAYELLGRTEIQAEVIVTKDDKEMIGIAFKSNLNGPEGPTADDIEHTVMLLVERNSSVKSIVETLSLPIGMVRSSVTSAKSKLARIKLQHAKDAVIEGKMPPAKAAQTFNVELSKLKEALGGKTPHQNGISDLLRLLSTYSKSHSLKTAAVIRKAFELYEDGDATAKQVEQVLNRATDLLKGANSALTDWRKRWKGKSKKSNTTAAAA